MFFLSEKQFYTPVSITRTDGRSFECSRNFLSPQCMCARFPRKQSIVRHNALFGNNQKAALSSSNQTSVLWEAIRTRLMLPTLGSPNPGFWNPKTLPVSLPSGTGEAGTSLRGRGFLSEDLRGDNAIGFDETELPEMMELVVP